MKVSKINQIANKLEGQTNQGLIEWKQDEDDPHRFYFKLENYSMHILKDRTKPINFFPTIRPKLIIKLQIFNKNDDLIDEHNVYEGSLEFSEMEKLYNEARRSAKGVIKDLNTIIELLEKKDPKF